MGNKLPRCNVSICVVTTSSIISTSRGFSSWCHCLFDRKYEVQLTNIHIDSYLPYLLLHASSRAELYLWRMLTKPKPFLNLEIERLLVFKSRLYNATRATDTRTDVLHNKIENIEKINSLHLTVTLCDQHCFKHSALSGTTTIWNLSYHWTFRYLNLLMPSLKGSIAAQTKICYQFVGDWPV